MIKVYVQKKAFLCVQSDIKFLKLCKANVAQVQTRSQVKGLGLTNEINQQRVEPTVCVMDGTNSKTKDCRIKFSLLRKTSHLLLPPAAHNFCPWGNPSLFF